LNQHVKLGSCFLINAPLLDILRNTNDRKPRGLIVAARLYALPDWVSSFPERIDELLVNDGDHTRGRGICWLKAATPNDRNAHRLEIVGRHVLGIIDDFERPY
jgi:hypothetical protein